MRPLLLLIICALASTSGLAAGNICYALPAEANVHPIVIWFLGNAVQQQLKDAPLIDEARGIRDAKPYFKSQNVHMADDSMALFFESKNMLVVAAPQNTQDLLIYLLD